MFAQRQALRALRSPMIQRRLASSAPKAGENAFITERRAVKEHAAGSTGRFLLALGARGSLEWCKNHADQSWEQRSGRRSLSSMTSPHDEAPPGKGNKFGGRAAASDRAARE